MSSTRVTQVLQRVRVRARKSVKDRGLIGTVGWGLHHLRQVARNLSGASRAADQAGLDFDARHQVDTAGKIELIQLSIQSANMAYGAMYQASSEVDCRGALQSLPIRHSQFAFIDFGCGKGRSLMVASEFCFQQIIGLDFSPELCAVARENLQILLRANPTYPQWQILCIDAAEYAIPDMPSVLYFYNPFDWEVMQAVVENIRHALQRAPREIYVIYLRPKHAALWESDSLFRTLHSTEQYRIYTNGLS